MNINPDIKPTLSNWAVGRKHLGLEAVELRRMKEEMVAAKYGTMQSMAKWDEPTIRETYYKLEALRAKDPFVPRKPNYEDLPISSNAIIFELPSASQTSSLVRCHLKRQKDISIEGVKRFEEDIIKEGIKNMILYELPDTNQADPIGQVMRMRIPSPLPITSLLVNPIASKIQKWSSDKANHELTLVRETGKCKRLQ
ncbi:hypothetical protein Hanom_Chr01g00053631 [Helianthus anomalus]